LTDTYPILLVLVMVGRKKEGCNYGRQVHGSKDEVRFTPVWY
jgi:hypothetical protein